MKKLIFLSIVASLFYSCALIISGKKQIIPVVTNVPGASVIVNDSELCKTPCIIKLDRKNIAPTIFLKKDSMQVFEVNLKKKLNELVFINNINIIAWTVDIFTNSHIKYQPLDTIILQPKKR